MEQHTEESALACRRTILKGAATFLLGGAVGILGKGLEANAADPAPVLPPPMPWPWVKLDPLEAGRRTFRAYLEKGG